MLVKHSGCNWKTPSYRGFSLFIAILNRQAPHCPAAGSLVPELFIN